MILLFLSRQSIFDSRQSTFSNRIDAMVMRPLSMFNRFVFILLNIRYKIFICFIGFTDIRDSGFLIETENKFSKQEKKKKKMH